MILILFSITLTAELLSLLAVIVSIFLPQRPIWPPPTPGSRWKVGMWSGFILSALGVIALGILDWGSTVYNSWIRWGLGLPLWLGGDILALWGMITLGFPMSFGSEWVVVKRGPYRFTRNPQYIGFIAGLVGWALLAASAWTLAAALLGALTLILAPFAEEVWLLNKYGKTYMEYWQNSPRFIGRYRK